MTATLTSPPSYAVQIWTNGKEIFIAYPITAGGPPYIQSYLANSAGLAKALAFLFRVQPSEPTAKPAVKPEAHPAIRRYANFSQTQRDQAQVVLRRLGLVKGGLN